MTDKMILILDVQVTSEIWKWSNVAHKNGPQET